MHEGRTFTKFLFNIYFVLLRPLPVQHLLPIGACRYWPEAPHEMDTTHRCKTLLRRSPVCFCLKRLKMSMIEGKGKTCQLIPNLTYKKSLDSTCKGPPSKKGQTVSISYTIADVLKLTFKGPPLFLNCKKRVQRLMDKNQHHGTPLRALRPSPCINTLPAASGSVTNTSNVAMYVSIIQ